MGDSPSSDERPTPPHRPVRALGWLKRVRALPSTVAAFFARVAAFFAPAFAFFARRSSRWSIPGTLTVAILCIVLVGAVEQAPRRRLVQVTLSVDARTEIATLDLASTPGQPQSWSLPKGTVATFMPEITPETLDGEHHCEPQALSGDFRCTFDKPVKLTFAGEAKVRIEAIPGNNPKISLDVTPGDGTGGTECRSAVPASIEIRDDANKVLLRSRYGLAFESAEFERDAPDAWDLWRTPLALTGADLGASLSSSVITGETLGEPIRQPVLEGGDAWFFARLDGWLERVASERYLIQEERFDPGDIVQIPESGLCGNRRLFGMITLDITDPDERAAFDVTLHTEYDSFWVARSTTGGHKVSVSNWSLLAKMPVTAAILAALLYVVVIVNYHAARLTELRGQEEDKTKRSVPK
jgi:hypothetical protein